MVYQMWTLVVHAAGQPAQRAWEVGAVRGEVIGASQPRSDRAVLRETYMILGIGLVSTAPLPMLSQLPFVRCASTAVEPIPIFIL